jgi:hypothetical protein
MRLKFDKCTSVNYFDGSDELYYAREVCDKTVNWCYWNEDHWDNVPAGYSEILEEEYDTMLEDMENKLL